MWALRPFRCSLCGKIGIPSRLVCRLMLSKEDNWKRGLETREKEDRGRKKKVHESKLFVQFQGPIASTQVVCTEYYQMRCIIRKRSSVSERDKAKTKNLARLSDFSVLRSLGTPSNHDFSNCTDFTIVACNAMTWTLSLMIWGHLEAGKPHSFSQLPPKKSLRLYCHVRVCT